MTVPSGISLTNNQPRDVRVTVNNVTLPGKYTGSLKFLLPGQSAEKGVEDRLNIGHRCEAQGPADLSQHDLPVGAQLGHD